MKTVGASLKLPASNWRPPGREKYSKWKNSVKIVLVAVVIFSQIIQQTNAQPFKGKIFHFERSEARFFLHKEIDVHIKM